MFDLIFFDLDGTLTASHEGVTRCVQYALASFGIAEECENLMDFIGPPLLESFARRYGFSTEQGLLAIEKYKERYVPIGMYECTLYDGIRELLTDLKAAGKQVAVATSKPYPLACEVLRYLGLYDIFTEPFIFAAPLDETKGSKTVVVAEGLTRCREMGIFTDHAILVGDRKYDIIGGHNNHLPVLGVGYGYAPEGELQAEGADYIVETVDELRDFFLGENKND